MKTMIDRILAQYGNEMTVTHGKDIQTVRAFLQPVTEKSWSELRKTVQQLGQIPAERYVYIGPAEAAVCDGDTVCLGERTFLVCRSEQLSVRGQALYVWALLRQREAADAWTE